jgi:hypothetical protein
VTRLRRSARAGLIVLLGALALGASGCGGSSGGGSGRLSDDDYRARLRTINGEVTKATSSVTQAAASATSVSALRDALSKYADAEKRFADEVAKLNPPKKAEAANALLARGFRDTAAQIRALLPKLGSATTPRAALALLQAAQKQITGGRELDRAVAELRRLGYSTGS